MSIDIEVQQQKPIRIARQEWRRGWMLVLSAALGIAISTSFLQFIGAMMKPLQDAHGWGRAEIAFGLTLITIFSPLANLCSGALADRFGPRQLALWGCLGFALGFCIWGLAGPSQWSWYLLCIAFVVIGQFANIVVWTMMVVRNFHSSRGLALALTLSGGGLTVAITPMLVVFLRSHFDVQSIFFLWGCVGGSIMLISTFLLFREPAAAPRLDPASLSRTMVAAIGHTLPDALRDRNFWQLALAILGVALAVGTFYVHLQPMLQDSGLSPASAASVALIVGPSLIGGRILIGLLLDRVDCRRISAVAFFLPAAACALLAIIDGRYGLALLTGFIIGIGLGAEIDIVAYLTSHYFGMRNYGKIFAILNGIYAVGIGIGSTFSGWVFDSTGAYESALHIMGASAFLAACLMASLAKPTAIRVSFP